MGRKPIQRSIQSKILDAIRSEVKASRGLGPVASDYYARQAKPKDGGYAKCNYVKGDGTRILPSDIKAEGLSVKFRPTVKRRLDRR